MEACLGKTTRIIGKQGGGTISTYPYGRGGILKKAAEKFGSFGGNVVPLQTIRSDHHR